ncbi:MAG: hypothetical protein HY820_34950 [Acidobacteria bacterium]|nr:hypothetical protein [Acidobacteriota bacterium]
MLKRLVLALGLLMVGVSTISAIDIPMPECLPCDDPAPPPSGSGGGN